MKKLLALLILPFLWSVAYGGVVKTDFNPKFQSIRLDSTGTGHVVVRTASGSGDTLDLYLMPVDSCGALFIGGVGSTHNDSLYYVPCNSNDTINLLRTGSGSTDSFMVDLTDSYTADSTWITPNDTLHIDTTTSGAGVYLPLTGGTMVGDIDMAGTNLVGVDTISGNNGTNILYIFGTEGAGDGSIIIGPHGVGGADTIIFAGNASSTPYRVFYISTALDSISAENHKITMVNDPDNAQDVATKNYVDTMKIVSSDIVDRTIVSADLDTGAVARLNLDTAGSYKVADLEADSLMTPKLVGSNRIVTIRGFKGLTGVDTAVFQYDTTTNQWFGTDEVGDTTFLGAGTGSADSIGYDTGAGTFTRWLYPAYLREGTNITFSGAGDTLTIGGPAGSGTADSIGYDTGAGTFTRWLYPAYLREGTNVTFSGTDDTLTISATGGGDTTSKVLYNPGTVADSLKIIGDTLSFDTDNDTAWIDAPNDFLVVKADQIGDGSVYTLDTLYGLYPNDSATRNLGRDTLPFATIYALGVGDTSTYGNIDLYGKVRFRLTDTSGTDSTIWGQYDDTVNTEPDDNWVYAWETSTHSFTLQSQTGGAGTIDSFMVDLTDSWTPDSTWITPDDTLHIDTTAGGSGDDFHLKYDDGATQAGMADTVVLQEGTGLVLTFSDQTIDTLNFAYDAALIVDTAELHDSLTNYSTTSAIETLIADSLDEYSVTTAIEALIADSLDEYSVTTAIESLIEDSLNEYSVTTAIEALIADSLDEYSLTTAIATTYLERAAFDDSVAHYSMVDSIGVDVDGGAIDTWHKAAFGLREGSNITFSMLGDTLTITGGAGGAFVASADTAGTGSNIVTSGDSIRIKQGSGIELSATTSGDGYILQIDATGSGYWTHTTPGAGDTSLIWAEPATDTFIQFKVDPTNDTVWVLANDGDNDKYLIFGADQVGTGTSVINVTADSVQFSKVIRPNIGVITPNGDSIIDFSGTGLTVTTGALQTSLGTSIDSAEISPGVIDSTHLQNGMITSSKLKAMTSDSLARILSDEAGTAGGFLRMQAALPMFAWRFSTTTTDSDPGTGVFRLDNATQPSATQAFVNDAVIHGGAYGGTLQNLVRKGMYLRMTAANATAKYLVFPILTVTTDASGYSKIQLGTVVDNGTAFANNDTVKFEFFSPYTGLGLLSSDTVRATSRLGVPTNTTTAPASEGALIWDTGDDWLVTEVSASGDTDAVIASKIKTAQMTIDDPDNLVGDTVAFLTVDSLWAPSGIVVTGLGVKTWTSTVYFVRFVEYTAPGNGGRTSMIDSVSTNTSTEARDVAIAAPVVEGGNIIYLELDTDDITSLHVWMTFYVRDQ